jgi:endonuclease YncB( thermonuclease family)
MMSMKKNLIILLILCWPLSAHAWVAKVVSVTDGDTIKVLNI